MRERTSEALLNAVNIWILAVIVLLYAVTGTGVGDDAIAAFSRGAVYRGTRSGAVALECAVTWDAQAMGEILDVLAERDVDVTFFVSGRWANAHAGTIERMIADGHEIGTCGYEPTLDGSVSLISRDIRASVGVIERITNTPVRYYHVGMRDIWTSARAARQLGLVTIASTYDLRTARYDAAQIIQNASNAAFDGNIYLMQPTAVAAEALPGLIDTLTMLGYEILPVGEIETESG